MSNELSVTDRAVSYIERVEHDIVPMLPDHVTFDDFKRAFRRSVAMNPTLGGCDPKSIIMSAIRCAETGLVPDGSESAIVPYGTTATFVLMIGGVRKLAFRGGATDFNQIVIYKGDTFKRAIKHGVETFEYEQGEERGEMLGCYAYVVTGAGTIIGEYVSAEEIEASAKKSRSPMWRENKVAAWKKTAGKKLAPRLGFAENLVKAASLDQEYLHETNEPEAPKLTSLGLIPENE